MGGMRCRGGTGKQVKERGGRVSRVYADGNYDSKENFDYLAENGIQMVSREFLLWGKKGVW